LQWLLCSRRGGGRGASELEGGEGEGEGEGGWNYFNCILYLHVYRRAGEMLSGQLKDCMLTEKELVLVDGWSSFAFSFSLFSIFGLFVNSKVQHQLLLPYPHFI
jgi:hypothetical protein